MKNPFEKIISGKELSRKKIEDEVEHITDGRGLKIDNGIKESVIVLKLIGLETGDSCEGHIDRALPYPWVDIVAPARNNARYLDLQKKYKEERFLTPSEIEEGLLLNAKIIEEEKEIENHLKNLLDEFYKNSDSEKIIIKKYASWHRILPIGFEKFGTIKRGEELIESEKQRRTEFLERSREEMGRFVSFLDKKFRES